MGLTVVQKIHNFPGVFNTHLCRSCFSRWGWRWTLKTRAKPCGSIWMARAQLHLRESGWWSRLQCISYLMVSVGHCIDVLSCCIAQCKDYN